MSYAAYALGSLLAAAPFTFPTPPRWRTETIPFPLEFAPELAYVGLEELRFAPGMFKAGAEDFWKSKSGWFITALMRPWK